MTNVDTDVELETSEAQSAGEVWQIPVPKAGKGLTVAIEIDKLHEKTYRQALFLGLKALAVRRMSKLPSTKDMQGKELEEQRAAIMKVAQANVQDMYEGKVRSATGAAKEAGVTREVKTEATRLAKAAIKAQLKAAGKKVSYIPARTISAAAAKLIADDPSWFKRAEASLAAAEKEREKLAISIEGIEEDETLIAKAEETKAKAKKPKAPPKAGVTQRERAHA